MANIKYTNRNGNSSYPLDLQNLTYQDCLTQLNLFEQNEFEQYETDRQFENFLVLIYSDGTNEIYEIEH